MPQTTLKLRDHIIGLLANATYGFNAQHAAIVSTYGVPAVTATFAATGSKTFHYTSLPFEELEEGQLLAGVSLPAFTLMIQAGANDGPHRKGYLFSGTLTAVLTATFELRKQEKLKLDTELHVDAALDALLRVFLRKPSSQANGIRFNGDVTFRRGDIYPNGDAWRQKLFLTLVFECDSN